MKKTNFYRDKRVLVTGGAGFIGSHLVEKLVALKAKVTVLDNMSSGKPSNLKEISHKIRLIVGDITSKKDCERAIKKNDVIFHLAALPSIESCNRDINLAHKINVEGTQNILSVAQKWHKNPKIIFSSSSAVYGCSKEKLTENSPLNPKSIYAETKAKAEKILENFSLENKISCVALRYFNVHGPKANFTGIAASAKAKFESLIKQGKDLLIYGDGTQTRDYVHIDQVVRANLSAGCADLTGFTTFNVASGKSMSVIELIKEIAQKMNVEFEKIKLKFTNPREGDVLHSSADNSKISPFLQDFDV